MAVKISKNVWIGGGVAGVAVLAVGVGWALAWPGGDADASPAVRVTVTAESTDVAPIVATAGAEAAADPIEVVVDPDGIADDEYPEAAPARTDPNEYEGSEFEYYATKVEYPDALVMEDWVWDLVGAGWSMALVSGVADGYHDSYVQPPAVLYLVSPEDVYFEVARLPDEIAGGAQIVSWDEDDGWIRLGWWEGSSSARFDYLTGAWEEIVFVSYGETAWHNGFTAANAEGDELWDAYSFGGRKYYRWDADSEAWSASALVDKGSEMRAIATSSDGDRVLVSLEDDQGATTGEVYLYTLSSDEVESYTVPLFVQLYEAARTGQFADSAAEGTRWGWGSLTGAWVDDTAVRIFSSSGVAIELDTTTGESVEVAEGVEIETVGSETRVGWGEATGLRVWDCGC
ncbi:hypothetical protein [Demequina sp. NBRC 110054]|uniref:hypothetical protein n=1 Tax=Demequina sp. NBRC 110054 TaxID=1570343 RepID=UPI000A047380|nr:hypothetical protein [Demequina sp. NBRC 110054]